MPANYEQPTYLDKRLRYFDGQFLKDQDFIDEQKYHVDRTRRLSRSLQVSGVSEGLAVTVAGSDRVTVNPGTGVDPKGRLIVLATPEGVSLVSYRNQTVSLLISYQEIEADRAQEGTEGNRRWHEKPLIQVALPGTTAVSEAIVLANLNVDKDGVIKVDNSVRQYSGVYLPAAGGKGPILRSGGDGASNKAVLTGDLSVSGTLEVNSLSIGSGGINLSNATINGNLTASGSITGSSLSVGNGNITAGSATISGNLTAGSATINGNLTTSGSITGSSLSLGSGNITAGDLSVGRITCQNVRAQVVAFDKVSTTAQNWVDLPDMSITVTTGNNPVLIMFKGGGAQGGAGLVRGRFRLLVDDVQKAFTLHEFHNSGWELRDVMLNWVEVLSAGQHTIKVQWYTQHNTTGTASTMSMCFYGDTRSIIVVEL